MDLNRTVGRLEGQAGGHANNTASAWLSSIADSVEPALRLGIGERILRWGMEGLQLNDSYCLHVARNTAAVAHEQVEDREKNPLDPSEICEDVDIVIVS